MPDIKNVLDKAYELYVEKNRRYGNSFDKSLDDDGLVVAKIRLGDKFSRLKSLINNPNDCGDESLNDTLIDIVNYAAMTIAWNSKRTEKPSNPITIEHKDCDSCKKRNICDVADNIAINIVDSRTPVRIYDKPKYVESRTTTVAGDIIGLNRRCDVMHVKAERCHYFKGNRAGQKYGFYGTAEFDMPIESFVELYAEYDK